MSWVGNANKYVVVSADSSVADAEDVRQFISCHLSKMCSDSTCYTYENIRYVYDAFPDEEEKISQFLSFIDCGIGLQNVFWMFLLTPNTRPKEQVTTYCDQQIWLRAGKIIGQLILKTASYKNQISFWAKRETLAIESEQILGEKIREYGPDFKVFSSYVDSAERRTAQLKTNLILKPYLPHNKETIWISPNNRTENTLIDDFSNNHAILEQLVTVLEKGPISYDEIITIVKKDNREVATATWLIEITIPQKGENGGT